MSTSSSDPSRVKFAYGSYASDLLARRSAAFVRQSSLFGRSVGGSRSISIDIVGPDADDILSVAAQVNDALGNPVPRP